MAHLVEPTRARYGIGFYLKLFLTVGILTFLATLVDWGELLGVVQRASPAWLTLGFSVSGLAFASVCLRWWIILRIQAVPLTYTHTGKLVFIGQFFSAFLMGANGGDVIRIFYAIRAVPDQKAKVTLTILIDRFLGISMLVVWMAAALPFEMHRVAQDPEMVGRIELLQILLALGVVAGLTLLFLPYHRLPAPVQQLWHKVPGREVIQKLHADSKLYLRRWHLSAAALAVAAFVHLCNFTAAYCLALGLGLEVSFVSIILIVGTIIMAVGAPLSIGGHGIREVAVIAAFTLFEVGGATREVCVAYSLLFYLLFQFSWSSIGGILYLFYSRRAKLEDATAPSYPGL